VRVRIEQAGNHRPSSKIDCLRIGTQPLSRVHDAPVLDHQRRPDEAPSVHEFSVYEGEIAVAAPLRDARRGSLGRRTEDSGAGHRRRTGEELAPR
jgi:hypothetical protein